MLGISESRQNIPDGNLSDAEKRLVFDFKRLDKMQKAKLLAYLQGLLQE